METIRALRARTAVSQLQQATLEPDTLLLLHRASARRPTTVFVLVQDDLSGVEAALPTGVLTDATLPEKLRQTGLELNQLS